MAPERPDVNTDDLPTEAHQLTRDEAMAVLENSNGYAVLRYDAGDDHIEYRWNPVREQFEQVTVDVRGPQPTLDGYHHLPRGYVADLLTDPPGTDLIPPELRAFPHSHFVGVTDEPRPLGFGQYGDDNEETEDDG